MCPRVGPLVSVVPSAFWPRFCPGSAGNGLQITPTRWAGQRPRPFLWRAKMSWGWSSFRFPPSHTWKEEKVRWGSPTHTPPACLLGSTRTPVSVWSELPLLCEQARCLAVSLYFSLAPPTQAKSFWRGPFSFNKILQICCSFCFAWGSPAIWEEKGGRP